MAESRRRSSSGGRLSGCRSWSLEDRVPNLKEGTVGLEVEDEDRLWWEKRVLGDLGGLEGEEDLDLSLEGDLEGLAGDLRAVEKDVRGEAVVGVVWFWSRSGSWCFFDCSLSFFFSCDCSFSRSLSFLKMWASWTIWGGSGVFPLFFFFLFFSNRRTTKAVEAPNRKESGSTKQSRLEEDQEIKNKNFTADRDRNMNRNP